MNNGLSSPVHLCLQNWSAPLGLPVFVSSLAGENEEKRERVCEEERSYFSFPEIHHENDHYFPCWHFTGIFLTLFVNKCKQK